MAINYYREMEKQILQIKKSGGKPKLLLHACCAPCSTHCICLLKEYFDITIYFYNPNMYPETEYYLRLEEERNLCGRLGVNIAVENHNPDEFYNAVKGREDDFEGGKRCEICIALRLDKTAEYAKNNGFDYFTTTLSISPLKNANFINLCGEKLAKKYGVEYLFADFKKKDGYLNSVKLSKEWGMYRQNYCGCEFSLAKNPLDNF